MAAEELEPLWEGRVSWPRRRGNASCSSEGGAREYKKQKQGKIQRALLASQLFSAVPPLEAVKALVPIMMSVSWSNAGKPLKFRHDDISRAHVQGTAQRLVYVRLPAENKVGRLMKSMYGT